MKSELSSVDIYVLTRELDQQLRGRRFDKFYQIAEKTLKIRLRQVKQDLIIAKNYLCLSDFDRKSPERPSSFAMQLRKHLSGGIIESVSQHSFDRIVIFSVNVGDRRYSLVAELFSKGNIFLLDSEWTILGLLEWQKWRDRTLGVGVKYSFPPSQMNPFESDPDAVGVVILKSDKRLAATIATELNLGGSYAEEMCILSGVDKNRTASDLTKYEGESILKALGEFSKTVKEAGNPVIVLDGGEPADISPMMLKKFERLEVRKTETFNQAVDELFSPRDMMQSQSAAESEATEKEEKLARIRSEQESAIKKLEEKARVSKNRGDLIYQSLNEIQTVVDQIRKARDAGLSDKDIMEKFEQGKKKDIIEAKLVKSLKKDKLVLDL
ncbi:MAG: NFACT family protein [Candidatus Altiarchaeota archaeon]